MMETLADNGNGNYAYVDDIDQAQKLFVEDLTSTLQVIALDAKIQVDFNPEVVAYYRLIGYENRDVYRRLWRSHSLDFRNDAVDAGEIGAGHSATALYAVMFRPNTDGRIATVQLRWEDPDTNQVTEIAPMPRQQTLATAISTPGTWLPASSRQIPITNWPWLSPNTLSFSATAPGLQGLRLHS